MELRLNQLAAHLERALAPIYVIHGDEPLQAIEAGDAIRAAARRAGFDEREMLVVEPGFKWDAFRRRQRQHGTLRRAQARRPAIPSGKPGVEGAKALEACAARVGPDQIAARHAAEARPRGAGVRHGSRRSPTRASPSPSIRSSAMRCRRGSRRASPASGSAPRRRRSPSSPSVAKATCSPRTRKSKSWVCCCPKASSRADAVERAMTDVARYDVFQLSEAWLLATPRVRCASSPRSKPKAKASSCCCGSSERTSMPSRRCRTRSRGGTPIAVAMRDARVWGKRQAAMERAARRVPPPTRRPAPGGPRAARCTGEGHRPRQRLGRAPLGGDDARRQSGAAASRARRKVRTRSAWTPVADPKVDRRGHSRTCSTD